MIKIQMEISKLESKQAEIINARKYTESVLADLRRTIKELKEQSKQEQQLLEDTAESVIKLEVIYNNFTQDLERILNDQRDVEERIIKCKSLITNKSFCS